MATYEVISEGNHIVPLTVKVTFPVNVSASSVQTIHVLTSIQGQQLLDFFAAYTLQTENAYKTLPEFTTQDTNRNGTNNPENKGQSQEDPNKTVYEITMNFTIENAVVEKTINEQTTLTGTERDAFLQEKADTEAVNFKASYGFTDLP